MKEMNLKTRTPRRPLSTLSKATLAALIINLCAQLFGFFIQWLAFGIVSIPLLIISVLLLIVTGLVIATGKRWALLLSVLVVLATSVLTLTRPGNSYSLLHPTDPGSHFAAMAVLLVSAVVAVVAGIAAAMQHDAGSQQFTSREQEEIRP